MHRERARTAAMTVLVAVTAFLPFLRGALAGASLYFRDLALQFLPLRRFALEGLAAGELRLWNPYVHEGVPLSLPALGYPLDLLQLLRSDSFGISLVLALHVPLAAVLFMAMARGLGLGRLAAAGGALVYALGGFVLSTLNLYVYVQAAAWAPLIVLAFARTLERGGRRRVALAAVALALGLSTTGVEVVAQALLIGLVLGWPRITQGIRRSPQWVASALLGGALAAPVLVLVAGQIEGSARGRGFPAEVVLAHSVHPFTLLQTVVASLYGDLNDVANAWWGQNFFPRGFPYVLSLYLGATTLALAAVGATSRQPASRRLLLLALGAGCVSLGRWAGLEPAVEALPLLRIIRYPVKAFFTVHFAAAGLVTLGLAALESEGARRAWERLAWLAGATGAVLVAALALPRMAPALMEAFGRGFFPPGFEPAERGLLLARVLVDAAAGGAIALVLALIAIAATRGWLTPTHAGGLAVAVMCADLLRAGGGLNPMVAPAFLRPSQELAAALPRLREGRVFTCVFDQSAAYQAARLARPGAHELWTFATALETLTPFANTPLGVATALSPDLTMLVPEDRLLSDREASCRHLDETLARLRPAGVRFVLSLDPLRHPELAPDGSYAPRRIAPLAVHVYRLSSALPLLQVTQQDDAHGRVLRVAEQGDRLVVELETAAPGRLLLREAHTPAWQARVDGRSVRIERVEGHYMAVPLSTGRQRVELHYRPPLLRLSLAASAVAAVLLLWLAIAVPGALAPRNA